MSAQRAIGRGASEYCGIVYPRKARLYASVRRLRRSSSSSIHARNERSHSSIFFLRRTGFGSSGFFLPSGPFGRARGHRAIGVVYHPERERGNFVPTVLPRRYDAFLYIDESHALHPLHIAPADGKEPPETYPWGF